MYFEIVFDYEIGWNKSRQNDYGYSLLPLIMTSYDVLNYGTLFYTFSDFIDKIKQFCLYFQQVELHSFCLQMSAGVKWESLDGSATPDVF